MAPPIVDVDSFVVTQGTYVSGTLRSQVVQSIDLFDFQNDVWEEVDSRDASRFTDLVTEISPGGNLARFVQPITLGIKARVRFESVNPRQKFTALIDQAIWIIE